MQAANLRSLTLKDLEGLADNKEQNWFKWAHIG